jgi:hypothetical protein
MDTGFDKIPGDFQASKLHTHKKKIITPISFLTEDETRERCSMYRRNKNCHWVSPVKNEKKAS